MIAWRIVKKKWATSAFSGEETMSVDGRWNEAGVRMVYSSENIPLAIMETLVHFQDVSFLLHHFVAVKVMADDACVLDLDQIATSWGSAPPLTTKEISMRWLHEGRSCILKVPSVLAPESYNYLINPLHPDFIAKVQLAPPIAIQYDPRLGQKPDALTEILMQQAAVSSAVFITAYNAQHGTDLSPADNQDRQQRLCDALQSRVLVWRAGARMQRTTRRPRFWCWA